MQWFRFRLPSCVCKFTLACNLTCTLAQLHTYTHTYMAVASTLSNVNFSFIYIVPCSDESADVSPNEASGTVALTGSGAGLALGIVLAVMAAVICSAAILYRRRKRGKKNAYITFGNPSYSREHLPANDFGLESPLTLSSNGYTVLA